MKPEEVQHEVSLFTGYGGLSLGLRLAGVPLRTVLYCEINPYRQSIIRRRVRDGTLDDAPLVPDVRTLDGRPFAGKVGVLTAGFPCQPHSVAGKRKGSEDPRNLWPDTARLIGEIRPGLVFLENVPGIASPTGGRAPYALTVLADLAALGYDARWGVVGARDVGAPHRRDRWWCLAHPTGLRSPTEERKHQNLEQPQFSDGDGRGRPLGDTDGTRYQGAGLSEPSGHPLAWPPGPTDTNAWARALALNPWLAPALSKEEAQSPVRGVADGPSAGVGGRRKNSRAHQLQALGDGVVPQAAALAFLSLLLEGRELESGLVLL